MDKPKRSVARKTAGVSAKKKAPAKRTPSTTTSKKRAVAAKKQKKKRLIVSVREQGLLLYPPTKESWLCSCDIINNGKNEECWVCGKKQSSKLLWPLYEKACAKVGVEIGTLWRIKSKINGTIMVREPGKRWRETELPENTTF